MNKRMAIAFMLALYILVSAIGISVYLQHRVSLTGMASKTQGTVNITINALNDSLAPNVTINSPTGTVTNITSISVYITFIDDQTIGTCGYNVTSSNGALVGDAFRQLVCSSGRDSLALPSAGTYTIHAFANDSTGNTNTTTQVNFTANAATTATAAETTAVSTAKGGHQAYRIQSDSLLISFRAGDKGTTSFSILNSMNTDMNFIAYLAGLDGVLWLDENEFTISARKEHKLNLVNIAEKPGEYTGELVISANNLIKKVSVAVSVSDNPNDIGLAVDYPQIYSDVCVGCEIGFSINFESEEAMAKVVFTIKDFDDNVVYRKNEVISVKDLPYNKVIKLPESMKEGKYALFVAVNSGSYTQVTSHMFNVVKTEIHEERPSINSSLLVALLLLALIVANLILLHKTK